jgi:DegV family protein with EDD domain
MSSGISATYNAAVAAAVELMEEFPDRFVHIVDSKGCGFGNALLALKAAELSKKGVDVREAAQIVDDAVQHACQYFTVDDLNFLKRTGRVSGFTAAIGTVLNIKPILYGDSTGHIVACTKVRGRRKAIEAVVEKYKEKKLDSPEQMIFISHGDCQADANYLADIMRTRFGVKDIVINYVGPVIGAHSGPGTVALFFLGRER